MSDTPSASGSPANALQFDHVEYAAPEPSATCRVCKQPMQQAYYEVNGQPFCERCHAQLQRALAAGSPLRRFIRATIYGSAAGLLGAGIYYGVREATNAEFGIIAILVGFIIGKAVKKGSAARGGWFYQGLAIFLTYTAIVLTYIPPLMKAIADEARKKPGAAKVQEGAKQGDKVVAAKAQEPAKADAKAGSAKADAGKADAARAGAAKPQPAPKAETAKAQQPAQLAAAEPKVAPARPPRPSLGLFLLAVVVLIGFAYAIPILIGFQSPIGLIIIGIALYEAWVINRRMRLTINGPFQIGQAAAGNAVHVEPTG
jgi:hypothetical protein